MSATFQFQLLEVNGATLAAVINTPSYWENLEGSYCGGKRQSPIDIDTSMVQADPKLLNFTFVNFTSQHVIKTIVYDGHTVKCKLKEQEVEVSGGGLDETYSTIQFHFHWGHTEHHPGSEHKINGYRYPMECFLFYLTLSTQSMPSFVDAHCQSEERSYCGRGCKGPDGSCSSWIFHKYIEPPINDKFSINDLLGNVDLTKYYRYMGSLTTPKCNEAVVWTVFHEPINLHRNLTRLFPMETGLPIAYRPTQQLNARQVFASPPLSQQAYSPSKWHLLPESQCGGHSQSPINIERKNAMVDKNLGGFTFKHFNDKHAIKTITNTGHTGREVDFTDEISIDDLLGDVNRASYYRYNGSLTTPSCNEAVVWTVFKETIKVDQALMNWLVAALAVCALVSSVHCASPSAHDSTWPSIAGSQCNGKRQSPIDIVTASAKVNENLTDFSFTGFDDTSKLTLIENTGKTVKVKVKSGVSVSGGDLPTSYNTLQFHLHWGNGTSVPGSEHTVDGKRYPMELHIVNIKSTHNGNTTTAVQDSTGLAALGFFIEAMDGTETGKPASWKTLTSYLANITKSGTSVSIAAGISLDDLLVGVNRSRYYRYLGSLTTPNCNEAVVWTVFKEPVKVSRDLRNPASTTRHNDQLFLQNRLLSRADGPEPSSGEELKSAKVVLSQQLLGKCVNGVQGCFELPKPRLDVQNHCTVYRIDEVMAVWSMKANVGMYQSMDLKRTKYQ
ncbi:Carbonic anhydrase 4 [Collichthys lucidus]|uniref:Carbonic anhydrase n=1 Tax=Collichthys lucidus TaxID=240159 RepID=A0A4U5VN67_COLLU|nr:Carbonic anhydrase 4 [Collichthys lucidus]